MIFCMYSELSSLTVFNIDENLIDFILKYFWLPLIVPLLMFGVKHIWTNHLSVKEISKITDTDISGFKQLYNQTINEELRIDPEEILKFVGKDGTNRVEHHLYICKHKEQVVGFMKFMYSPDLRCIFMAYVAIDRNDSLANNYGVKKLSKKVVKHYFKNGKANSFITEITRSNNDDYNTSLSKQIARYARMYHLEAYYINAPYYIQPVMPDCKDSTTKEDLLSLIYIPYSSPTVKNISKESFLRFIRFIYLDIYAPCCKSSINDCSDYTMYLDKLINDYRNDCPDSIELISLGGN